MTKQKEKKEIIKNCSTIIDELENMCFKKPNTKQQELKKAFKKRCYICNKKILFHNTMTVVEDSKTKILVPVCDECYRREIEKGHY